MKTVPFAALLAMTFASSAPAQVIYQPIRYQVGPNIYYGGTNPAFRANPNLYIPPGLQAAPPVAEPLSGSVANAPPSASPPNANSPLSSSPAISAPHVFSDALPYQEASQYGYTPNDARNEAYANVPRIQYGQGAAIQASPSGAAPQVAAAPAQSALPVVDPKLKAIPLLNWAKAERARNPELYQAIIAEARRYDAAATDRLEQTFATEK